MCILVFIEKLPCWVIALWGLLQKGHKIAFYRIHRIVYRVTRHVAAAIQPRHVDQLKTRQTR